MDKSTIRNAIIRKIAPDNKYRYSFYGYDHNRKYNIMFIVTDKMLYLWEDIGNNLTIKMKYYEKISKINLVKNNLFLNFEDENFTLSQISKEDGELLIFYKFTKDFYDAILNNIVNKTKTQSKSQTSILPQFKQKRQGNQEKINAKQNKMIENEQDEHIPDIQNKRMASLAMFDTTKKQTPKINTSENTDLNKIDRDSKNLEESKTKKNNIKNLKDNKPKNKSKTKKRSKLPVVIIILIVFIALIGGILFIFINNTNSNKPDNKVENTTDINNEDNNTGYTKTQKEAEIKLDDLYALQEIIKKDNIIYTTMSQVYDRYKENPSDFDYDAAKAEIDSKFNEYKDISVLNITLKSNVSGNVEGNYIYEELKKNESALNDVKTSLYLNFDNKFSDNGRVVELETLLQNMLTSNQSISSLIKDEIEIFENELQEKYGVGNITDTPDNIDVEQNEELIGNTIEN